MMSEENSKEKNNVKQVTIDIFVNLVYSVLFMLYYPSIGILNSTANQESLYLYIRISCMVFLAIGIIAFEVAYKKDKMKYAIHGIEFLVISFYTLMIRYVVVVNKLDFNNYVTISSYAILVYYVIKCMFIYTIDKKKYLDSFSDIEEIVKQDVPLKKEAKKKENNNINEEIEENVIQKETAKTKRKKEKKKKTTKNKGTEKNKKATKAKKEEPEVLAEPPKKRGRPRKIKEVE